MSRKIKQNNKSEIEYLIDESPLGYLLGIDLGFNGSILFYLILRLLI